MATRAVRARAPSAATRSPTTGPRSPAPVRCWAAIGGVILAVQLGGFVTWFTRGDATAIRPTTEVPAATRAWAISLQAVMVVAFVAMVVWVVYLVNLGSWVNGIPGWTSPNMERLPEPLLMIGLSYVAFGMGMTLVLSAVMRAVRRRRPDVGIAALLAWAFAAMVVLELAAELVFVRTGMYAYPGVIRGLSMWGGETYQYPIYSAFLAAPVFVGAAALRELRDDRGRSHIERGVDAATIPRRWQAPLRVLAASAFINVLLIVGYFVPMIAISLRVDATPSDYPPYLINGICGEASDVPCPGPDEPVHTRGSDPR